MHDFVHLRKTKYAPSAWKYASKTYWRTYRYLPFVQMRCSQVFHEHYLLYRAKICIMCAIEPKYACWAQWSLNTNFYAKYAFCKNVRAALIMKLSQCGTIKGDLTTLPTTVRARMKLQPRGTDEFSSEKTLQRLVEKLRDFMTRRISTSCCLCEISG